MGSLRTLTWNAAIRRVEVNPHLSTLTTQLFLQVRIWDAYAALTPTRAPVVDCGSDVDAATLEAEVLLHAPARSEPGNVTTFFLMFFFVCEF